MSATESISKKLFDALSNMVSMHSAMMAKTNIGASFYDADTLRAMNDAPIAAGKALDEYAANEQRWVMRVVVISNDHLHEETFSSFLEDNVDDMHQGAAIFRCDEGFIVRVIDADEDAPEDYPAELVEALTWARTQGYTHVRFDPDGDIVAVLQEFEW